MSAWKQARTPIVASRELELGSIFKTLGFVAARCYEVYSIAYLSYGQSI
jgi:hypothetical protein